MNSGLSIVAVNEDTGKIVGVTACYDPSVFDSFSFCQKLNFLWSIPKKLGPMFAIADEV